jgi:hypothetical protein
MSFALDRARHLPQFRLDDEAVAVLGHDIARIGELCLLTFAPFLASLASGSVIEPCV